MIYYNKVLDKKCQNQFNFDINSILDNHFNQIKNQDEVLKKRFNELNFKIFFDIQNEVKESECTICLVPYQQDQQLIALKCNKNYNFYHAFHKDCLQLWFIDMKKDSCPLCRAKI
ncbi:hypothetical protein PPERSA_06128 [Pseudocohnilembus persalinus]|uniref:RING-type domain-containing protein n=1 Tax=Pseudocohnilembus persalinus TaxID=266149 RepID=A0A0V0QVL5_PSEPJ|nr:hypothetical protein PPERSA_06128 [Pseudocohnilembus persalinus]|eukprot:KRX06246.1 hypothetical protein PPERSA_06128 [Pseudocohnilembus persalinus]